MRGLYRPPWPLASATLAHSLGSAQPPISGGVRTAYRPETFRASRALSTPRFQGFVGRHPVGGVRESPEGECEESRAPCACPELSPQWSAPAYVCPVRRNAPIRSVLSSETTVALPTRGGRSGPYWPRFPPSRRGDRSNPPLRSGLCPIDLFRGVVHTAYFAHAAPLSERKKAENSQKNHGIRRSGTGRGMDGGEAGHSGKTDSGSWGCYITCYKAGLVDPVMSDIDLPFAAKVCPHCPCMSPRWAPLWV